MGDLLSELHRLDERIARYDAHIQLIAREDEAGRQLMRLSGVGRPPPFILAMIGNGHEFEVRPPVRRLAGVDAWAVQLRRQDAPGAYLTGDAYLRTMLILGARAVLAAAKNKTDGLSRWAMALEERRGCTGRRW